MTSKHEYHVALWARKLTKEWKNYEEYKPEQATIQWLVSNTVKTRTSCSKITRSKSFLLPGSIVFVNLVMYSHLNDIRYDRVVSDCDSLYDISRDYIRSVCNYALSVYRRYPRKTR